MPLHHLSTEDLFRFAKLSQKKGEVYWTIGLLYFYEENDIKNLYYFNMARDKQYISEFSELYNFLLKAKEGRKAQELQKKQEQEKQKRAQRLAADIEKLAKSDQTKDYNEMALILKKMHDTFSSFELIQISSTLREKTQKNFKQLAEDATSLCEYCDDKSSGMIVCSSCKGKKRGRSQRARFYRACVKCSGRGKLACSCYKRRHSKKYKEMVFFFQSLDDDNDSKNQ